MKTVAKPAVIVTMLVLSFIRSYWVAIDNYSDFRMNIHASVIGHQLAFLHDTAFENHIYVYIITSSMYGKRPRIYFRVSM